MAQGHDPPQLLNETNDVGVLAVEPANGVAQKIEGRRVGNADTKRDGHGSQRRGARRGRVAGPNVGGDARGYGKADGKWDLVEQRHGRGGDGLGGQRGGPKARAQNGEHFVGKELGLDHYDAGDGKADENGPV